MKRWIVRCEAGGCGLVAGSDGAFFGFAGFGELVDVVAGLLGTRHECERGLLEREGAGVVGEFVEEGLGEERDVVGGGEDAGVAGYSAHAAGGGVVDNSPQEMVEIGISSGGAFIVMSRWRGARSINGYCP